MKRSENGLVPVSDPICSYSLWVPGVLYCQHVYLSPAPVLTEEWKSPSSSTPSNHVTFTDSLGFQMLTAKTGYEFSQVRFSSVPDFQRWVVPRALGDRHG